MIIKFQRNSYIEYQYLKIHLILYFKRYDNFMTRPNISFHVSGIEDAFYKIRCDSLQKDCHNVFKQKSCASVGICKHIVCDSESMEN